MNNPNQAIDDLVDGGYRQGVLDFPEAKIYVAYEEWRSAYQEAQEDCRVAAPFELDHLRQMARTTR